MDKVTSITINLNNNLMASGSSDNTIRVWDLSKFTQIKKLEGHTQAISSLFFYNDDKYIISSSKDDDSIRMWDWKKESLLMTKNIQYKFICLN